MYGPAKPPRFPVALMSAMLAAAAGPLRKIVGRAQKGDGNEYSAMVAAENAAIARTKWLPAAMLSDNATPTSSNGIAACHRRSPVLSECQAVMSIIGMATSQGIPEIRITCVVLSPEMRRTIVGSQELRPTLFVM